MKRFEALTDLCNQIDRLPPNVAHALCVPRVPPVVFARRADKTAPKSDHGRLRTTIKALHASRDVTKTDGNKPWNRRGDQPYKRVRYVTALVIGPWPT